MTAITGTIEAPARYTGIAWEAVARIGVDFKRITISKQWGDPDDPEDVEYETMDLWDATLWRMDGTTIMKSMSGDRLEAGELAIFLRRNLRPSGVN